MTLTARSERFCLCLLLVIFTWFTAHGLRMFFSGDDMMNMYNAWNQNPWRLGRSLLFVWMPVYRPLGAVVYRVFYALFGFHNLPLYIFCWLLLAFNVVLSYKFFRTMRAAIVPALTAVSLTLVHGNFQDLYLSAGTIYDRLWFLFTLLGLIVYARMKPSLARSLLVAEICLLAMASKESGVALPALLACYEVIFILPDAWGAGKVGEWLKAAVPLYAVLAVLSVVFVLRVGRTPELSGTAAYHPHASLGVWLSHMGEYFTTLVYRQRTIPGYAAATLLIATALAAGLARNRLMIFGWLFFVITITPVALITTRPGYVLYVPDIGIGLYAAGLAGLIPERWVRLQLALFLVVTAATTFFHVRNWPGPFPPEASPEKRFSEQFQREYPKLPPNSKLLFASDDFPPATWDLPFNTWLLYHDRSI
ncbi:MAG: hypothetical protein M3N54_16415, partial [Acidobacteriota bacterium]|nr:hypothetical protein [Acidobacteriota bacterium]